MYTISANSSKVAYGVKTFTLDQPTDLNAINIKTCSPGSKALVLSTSETYMLNNKKEWVKVSFCGGSGGGGDQPVWPDEVIYDGGVI